MLTEAVEASAGGTALVSAMVIDGWESVKGRVARLLGRGDPAKTEAAAARLEESRSALAGHSGPDLDRAREGLEAAWRTRLGDLLEDEPALEGDLRVLVADVQAQMVSSSGLVVQHAEAHDRAQQAVLGHGVQNVNFGGQSGSPSKNG